MCAAWLVCGLLLASSSAAAAPPTVRTGDGSLSLTFDGAAITATSLGVGGDTTKSQSAAFSLTEFSSTCSDEWFSRPSFPLESFTV